MKYNKLVRDRIPEIIANRGVTPITHLADDVEYWETLKAKLREEVDEFIEDSTDEELADILEVLNAIYEFRGVDVNALEELRMKKAKERGAFNDKVILDEVKDKA